MADGAAVNDAPHVYLTVSDDDENQVLELVKVDETGMYIRDNESWVKINPDDDNPNVWDRVIVDVSENAANIYDKLEASDTPITADQFSEYELSEEQL